MNVDISTMILFFHDGSYGIFFLCIFFSRQYNNNDDINNINNKFYNRYLKTKHRMP